MRNFEKRKRSLISRIVRGMNDAAWKQWYYDAFCEWEEFDILPPSTDIEKSADRLPSS